MSQRSVEQVIGRLATDEGFRRRFQSDREAALDEMIVGGHPLTLVERRALSELDLAACERFADCLDARIQKISLRREAWSDPCEPQDLPDSSGVSGSPKSPR